MMPKYNTHFEKKIRKENAQNSSIAEAALIAAVDVTIYS